MLHTVKVFMLQLQDSGEMAYSQDAMVWLELDNPLGGNVPRNNWR